MPPPRSPALVALLLLASACKERLSGSVSPPPGGGVTAASESVASLPHPARSAPSAELAPFAVAELFTSEGCSSCPPADEVLRRLAAESSGQRVFVLSFHVDYWNQLGYPDPMSSPVFTARQEAYARAFGARGVYTPQLVVGGTDELVGSDGPRARGLVDAALARPARARVALRLEPRAGSVLAAYSVSGAPAGAVLHLALAEGEVISRVPRGENAGKTLRHVSVVRAFQTVVLEGAPEGGVRVAVPASMAKDGATITAYVQRPDTMEVLGAARALLLE